MATVKVSEVTVGTTLIADALFDCIKQGARLTVEADKNGELFVPCKQGKHYLYGQYSYDSTELIGFSHA